MSSLQLTVGARRVKWAAGTAWYTYVMRPFGEGGPPVPEEVRRPAEKKEEPMSGIPEHELQIDFVRSSGPGGQKVNKTSSKAQLRWNVGASASFSEEQKARIREAAGNRLNADDEIVLSADTERSQLQNRADVVARLERLVAHALTPKKERKETKVPRSQKRKRLEGKRRDAEKKRMRKPPKGDW